MSETHSLSEVPGFILRTLRRVDFIGKRKLNSVGDPYMTYAEPVISDVDKANIITSVPRLSRPMRTHDDTLHAPVLDFDFPCILLDSTTPGHHHLMIEKELSWWDYLRLLRTLRDIGLLEPGYVAASEQRGYTAIRLPWVKRESREELLPSVEVTPDGKAVKAPKLEPIANFDDLKELF